MAIILIVTSTVVLVSCGKEKTASDVYNDYITKLSADINGKYRDFDIMVTFYDAEGNVSKERIISYSETDYTLYIVEDDPTTAAVDFQERISFRDEIVSRKISVGEVSTTNAVLDTAAFDQLCQSIYDQYFLICVPESAEKILSWKNVFKFSGSINYEVVFSQEIDSVSYLLKLGFNTITDKPHMLEIKATESEKKLEEIKFNYPRIGKLIFNKVVIPDLDTMIEKANLS